MGKQRKRQHSSHLTTHKHKKDKTLPRSLHLEITPEQLLEKGNLQGAVDLLKPYLAKHPTDDDKRRMLGNSLFNLGQYREAADTLLALQQKNYADLVNIGTAYLNLEEWDQAITWLEASLQQQEWAHTCYLLALAHLRGNNSWRRPADPDRIEHTVDLLQQARALPNCPAVAYLLLNDKLWLLACNKPVEGGEARERERNTARAECYQVMEEAFALYPDNPWIRLEYAEDLVDQHLYETALLVLAPLVNRDDIQDEPATEKAIAYAIEASIGSGLYEKAFQYTELLPIAPLPLIGKPYHPSLLKLKGDLFLYQDKLDIASTYYEQATQSNSFLDQFLGLFSSAWIWLQREEWEQGRMCAKKAADLWFSHDDEVERQCAIDCIPTAIETVYLSHIPGQCIEQVCKKLLQEDTSLDTKLRGQLSYILYTYNVDFYRGLHLTEEKKAEQAQLLQQSAHWYAHPLISDDLVALYLALGDIPQAVEHYFLSRTYYFTSHPDDFYEETTAFSRHAEKITTKEERDAVHAVAFQTLQRCKDASTIRSVFLPFFDEFWYPILKKGEMHQELIDVMKILIDASDEVNVLWFNYAWELDELEKNEEAEHIYRRYVEHHPNDASALHNLSLLLEQKGCLEEALELSTKAATFAPDDEDIVNRKHLLQRTCHEQEQSRLEKERQKQTQLWLLLSESQKRLLCLMELYPSGHWTELLPHMKKDERQLQEDWEWLLAHGACVQSEAEAPVSAVPLLQLCIWEEGFLCWLASEIAKVQARKKKNLWLPEAVDLEDEQLAQLSSTQRDLVHQALMRQITSVSLSGLEHLHLLFYRRVWKQLLIQWKAYAELVDLCHVFLTRLSVMTRQELWECAYYATDLSSPQYRTIAEKCYKDYLEQGESHPAYHNLSVLYLRKSHYQDALRMIEHALRLNPLDTGSLNLKAKIEQAIKDAEEQQAQQERERQRQKEQREHYLQGLEQKIQAHLGEVDVFKQKILQAVKDARYSYNKRSLAQQLRMEDWSFEGHWKKLVFWGMILEEGKRTELHPLVSSYLEQGWPVPVASSMRTVVINPAAGSLTKPVFGSKQEYKLYTVLLEIFHGQLVFPNMALQALFPYKKMKEVLTKEEFSYYMVSSVDICITRTTSYFPLVAFEVDGPHHEDEERQRKDALKNAIFEKGGLGLIRLQIGYQPLSTKELWEDVRAKIHQALYTWRSDSTRKGWMEDIEAELGMSRFGNEDSELVSSPPQWEERKQDEQDEEGK